MKDLSQVIAEGRTDGEARRRQALEDLRAARFKIADPARWTRRVTARNEAGEPVGSLDATACQWCALGALEAVTGGTEARYDEAYEWLRNATGELSAFSTPADLNDFRGHAETLDAYNWAIRMAAHPFEEIPE